MKEKEAALKLLAKEVGKWPVEEFEVWNLNIKACCREAETLPQRNWPEAKTLKHCWGWLSPDKMEKGCDRWELNFSGKSKRETRWGEAGMPRYWEGGLSARLCDEGGEPSWIFGQPKVKSGNYGKVASYWGVPCWPSAGPKFPRLGPGQLGKGRAGSLQLLGVLLRRSQDDDRGPSEDSLEVAWGDRQGEFLGWERVVSMAVVHGLRAHQVRHFHPLEGWGAIEEELRERSWGREL